MKAFELGPDEIFASLGGRAARNLEGFRSLVRHRFALKIYESKLREI